MKTWLNTKRVRQGLFALLLFLAATSARAGTVSGIVHNGTNSNKAAAGVDVLLIQLQGGMQTAASTKTDAEGRYHFDNPAIGSGPMLIRAVYRGVFFHQPLTPGTATVDVTVYEPTTNPAAIQIPLRLLVFQPNGDKLMVGEEFSIQNNSNPPAAYFKQRLYWVLLFALKTKSSTAYRLRSFRGLWATPSVWSRKKDSFSNGFHWSSSA